MSAEFPCDYETACYVLHALRVKRWSQIRAALHFCIHPSTVGRIRRGQCFQDAVPVAF
jgi:hypothetical protein